METSFYIFKVSAIYRYQSRKLSSLSIYRLVGLILYNITKKSTLFLVYMSNCLYMRSSKIKTYLRFTHLLRHGIASLNTSWDTWYCWWAGPFVRICQLPLAHSWVEFVMRDDGLDFAWVRRLIGVRLITSLVWRVYVMARPFTRDMRVVAR